MEVKKKRGKEREKNKAKTDFYQNFSNYYHTLIYIKYCPYTGCYSPKVFSNTKLANQSTIKRDYLYI